MNSQLPGRLVALEGIDGAGKHTQAQLLAAALARRRIAHQAVSFPRYESFFGQLIARYLQGAFGPLEAVDPHLSALLYAADRLEARPWLKHLLAAGRIVIANRYVASNLAHQGARVAAEQRTAFLAWLKQLEYEIFDLPREDLILYLRLPVEEALRRTTTRAGSQSRDLQESSREHLLAAAQLYDELARESNWVIVEAMEGARARSVEELHAEILQVIEERVLR